MYLAKGDLTDGVVILRAFEDDGIDDRGRRMLPLWLEARKKTLMAAEDALFMPSRDEPQTTVCQIQNKGSKWMRNDDGDGDDSGVTPRIDAFDIVANATRRPD